MPDLSSLRPLLRPLGCGWLYFHRPERAFLGTRLVARCSRCHKRAAGEMELLWLDPLVSLSHPLMAENSGKGRGRA